MWRITEWKETPKIKIKKSKETLLINNQKSQSIPINKHPTLNIQ